MIEQLPTGRFTYKRIFYHLYAPLLLHSTSTSTSAIHLLFQILLLLPIQPLWVKVRDSKPSNTMSSSQSKEKVKHVSHDKTVRWSHESDLPLWARNIERRVGEPSDQWRWNQEVLGEGRDVATCKAGKRLVSPFIPLDKYKQKKYAC
jgi:hypothetical protein